MSEASLRVMAREAQRYTHTGIKTGIRRKDI
jgi:hypothetical protein